MERVKLHLPKNFHFSTSIRIRITDLNYGGHVGNDSFLSLIHEARQQYLRHFGYAELDFAGVGLIMADVAIEYKQELNYADEVKISVSAIGFDRIGFDIFYLLELVQETGNVLSGKAKTGMICYDYANRKKVAVPIEAREKIERATTLIV
jgi:acyl-CoA thioester hydrolase